MIFNKKAALVAATAFEYPHLVLFIVANFEVKMLIKIGDRIINLAAISAVDLDYQDLDRIPSCVRLIIGDTCLYFFDEEADLLRWYFNHPLSKVKDLKGLRG